MTQDDYNRWANYHAALFGFTTETDAAMFEAWFYAFNLACYSAAELMEVSNWMATTDQKPAPGLNLRERHLLAIRQRVTALRLQFRQAQQEGGSRDDWSACSTCSGKGLVVVPNPRSIVDDLWVNSRTCAVACACTAGERLYQSNVASAQKDRRHRPPLRLTDYEVRFPGWREMFGRKARECSAFDRASTASREVSRLAKKTQAPI